MDKIVKHFDKYLPLHDTEKAALKSRLMERKIKRRQYILQEGDTCKYFNYVMEGCFKMYGIDHSGTEHNLVFAAEDDWITDLDSLHKERPSKLFIEAIEPSTILQISKGDLWFNQTTDFHPGPGVLNLTSAGNADIYVSKLNANGYLAWAFSMGNTTSDAGTGIATDASGNVYVSGSFSGTVDFDPGPGTTNLTGGGKFLCKFDTNGNLLWASALAGTLSVDLPMAVDAADNLYLAGGFSGTADFDPGVGTFNMTSAGSTDIIYFETHSFRNLYLGQAHGKHIT